MLRPSVLPLVLFTCLASSFALAKGAPKAPKAAATAQAKEKKAPGKNAGENPEPAPQAVEAAPVSDIREATAPASGERAPEATSTLLVLDLVDRGAGPELTKALTEALAAESTRALANGAVVTAEGLRQDLQADALAALSGCDAEGCMRRLAEAVEADLVIGGSAALLGGDVVITVVLVNAALGERLGEAQRKVPAHPELARYATRALTAKAFRVPALEEPVPVLLESTPEGARAFVDGNAVGNTPVLAPLTPGSHELTFRADGHDDQKLVVTVEDGAPLVLRAELRRPTIRLWPYAAGLGGVSLLAALGGGWAGIAAANAYDGSFGFFTPEEDIARSYLHASPVDSRSLAAKQQRVEQLSILANVLWGTAAATAAAAILVEGADLALSAMSE